MLCVCVSTPPRCIEAHALFSAPLYTLHGATRTRTRDSGPKVARPAVDPRAPSSEQSFSYPATLSGCAERCSSRHRSATPCRAVAADPGASSWTERHTFDAIPEDSWKGAGECGVQVHPILPRRIWLFLSCSSASAWEITWSKGSAPLAKQKIYAIGAGCAGRLGLRGWRWERGHRWKSSLTRHVRSQRQRDVVLDG